MHGVEIIRTKINILLYREGKKGIYIGTDSKYEGGYDQLLENAKFLLYSCLLEHFQ